MSFRSIVSCPAAALVIVAVVGCTEDNNQAAPDAAVVDASQVLDGEADAADDADAVPGADAPPPGKPYEDDHCVVLPSLASRQGPLALLILLPDAQVDAADYLDLARAIQQASPLALAVGIAKFSNNKPAAGEAKTRLTEIPARVRTLCACPLDAKRVLLAGHGLGGAVAIDLVAPPGFAGLVLLASYLPELPGAPDLESHPTPVLTLGGALDGLTWVTRIAEESRKQELLAAKRGEAAAAAKPVVVVSQVNHAQFAAGKQVPGDIPAEIPLDQAHRRIAGVVADFALAQLSSDAQAASRLNKAVQDSRQRVSAYLEARDMEDGTWCDPMQESLSSLSKQDLALLNVSHTFHTDMFQFLLSKPSIAASGGQVTIKTSAFATHAKDPDDDSPSLPESALELACKMKSQKAIKEKLSQATFGAPRTCADLNAEALKWALSHVPPEVKKRYEAQGKELSFIADKQYAGGHQWAPAPLALEPSTGKPPVVEVCSPALMTDTSVPLGHGGMHYCKLLSPARAVEWVMVEGLRP